MTQQCLACACFDTPLWRSFGNILVLFLLFLLHTVVRCGCVATCKTAPSRRRASGRHLRLPGSSPRDSTFPIRYRIRRYVYLIRSRPRRSENSLQRCGMSTPCPYAYSLIPVACGLRSRHVGKRACRISRLVWKCKKFWREASQS